MQKITFPTLLSFVGIYLQQLRIFSHILVFMSQPKGVQKDSNFLSCTESSDDEMMVGTLVDYSKPLSCSLFSLGCPSPWDLCLCLSSDNIHEKKSFNEEPQIGRGFIITPNWPELLVCGADRKQINRRVVVSSLYRMRGCMRIRGDQSKDGGGDSVRLREGELRPTIKGQVWLPRLDSLKCLSNADPPRFIKTNGVIPESYLVFTPRHLTCFDMKFGMVWCYHGVSNMTKSTIIQSTGFQKSTILKTMEMHVKKIKIPKCGILLKILIVDHSPPPQSLLDPFFLTFFTICKIICLPVRVNFITAKVALHGFFLFIYFLLSSKYILLFKRRVRAKSQSLLLTSAYHRDFVPHEVYLVTLLKINIHLLFFHKYKKNLPCPCSA
ncbi:hypothetical protein VP01_1208g3 [Puccinia sorghi]|uniref:Uncharacterized protein n=1 Tax=Puccinia sorghi TaxID=27349 RepID=A0A0L6VRU7_9BASI|nr:hypothetical protein VP01_1208g3 [Puccinia sorghi]